MQIFILISILFGANLIIEKNDLSKIATEHLFQKIEESVEILDIQFEGGTIKIDEDLIKVKITSLRESKAPRMAIDIERNGQVIKNLRYFCKEWVEHQDNLNEINEWIENLSDGLISWMISDKPDRKKGEFEIFFGSNYPIQFGSEKIEDDDLINILNFEDLDKGINLVMISAKKIVYKDDLDFFMESKFYARYNDKIHYEAEVELSKLNWPKEEYSIKRYYLVNL